MAGAPICFERVFNSVFVDSFHYIAKRIRLLILNVKVFFLSSIKKILYWRTAHHWRNRIISCRYISLLCSYSSFCSIWSLISIQGSRYCRCFIVMHGEVTTFLILKVTENNSKKKNVKTKTNSMEQIIFDIWLYLVQYLLNQERTLTLNFYMVCRI